MLMACMAEEFQATHYKGTSTRKRDPEFSLMRVAGNKYVLPTIGAGIRHDDSEEWRCVAGRSMADCSPVLISCLGCLVG